MTLSVSLVPDDPSLQAAMAGPLVLAARMGTAGLDPPVLRAEPTQPRKVPEYKREGLPTPTVPAGKPWFRRDGNALRFDTVGPKPMQLVPLFEIFDERYAVYFRVT